MGAGGRMGQGKEGEWEKIQSSIKTVRRRTNKDTVKVLYVCNHTHSDPPSVFQQCALPWKLILIGWPMVSTNTMGNASFTLIVFLFIEIL